MATAGLMTGTASAAPVLPDFTVDQSGVSSCALIPGSCQFTADKMIGGYNEVFTVTGANTFSTVAYWNLGNFYSNDGADLVSTPFLNFPDVGAINGYAIYAVFEADGGFVANPGPGAGFTFAGTSGSVKLYLDPSVNSNPKTLPATAPGTIGIANSGDDQLLASADLLGGEGSTSGGLANGDFALAFKPFELTALGSTFFVAPNPFYVSAVLKGQFNSFQPVGTQVINGSLDAFFSPDTIQHNAPEPTSLVLLGMGLLGSGIVGRRRKS